MGRSPCCDKSKVKRGPWSPEEDAVLRNFVEIFGNGGNWIALPQKAGLRRCGKSCRLRWLNYLRPALRHGGFTDEEDNLILSLYGEIGSKWSVIASKLRGRTDNDVKNYWNTKLKKRYFATTRESSTTPPPPPTDDAATSFAASTSPPSPTPPALVNPESALDTDDDQLLQKSDQLYAELAGLIEQPINMTMTTTTSPSDEVSVTTASPSDGSTPSTSGSIILRMDVLDTLLSEPSSFDSSTANYCDLSSSTHTFGAPLPADSFEDFESLLKTFYDDVTMEQDLLYYYD